MVWNRGQFDNKGAGGGDGDENTFTSGSEAWNVADAFVKLKIFKPIYDCDVLEIVALYGTEKMGDIIMPEEIPHKRVEAIYRYKDTLKLTFNNAGFIIRKDDKKAFNKLREHLDFIEKIMDGVSQVEENHVTHTNILVINEEHFKKCLHSLQKVKEEVNTYLNRAGLIFRQSDDMTFQELLQDISEGG